MQAVACILVFVCVTVMSGFTAVGVVPSADPLTKLNDAQVLFSLENRPVLAERLIREALAIYQRDGNAHGLGMAYREYGDFLRSAAVANWAPQYQRNGFLNESITFDNRLSKASEFYKQALEHLEQAVQQRQSAGQYDALTNVYYNIAWTHLALGEQASACKDVDDTLVAYSENTRRNPDAKPIKSREFGSLPEELAHERRRAGCQ